MVTHSTALGDWSSQSCGNEDNDAESGKVRFPALDPEATAEQSTCILRPAVDENNRLRRFRYRMCRDVCDECIKIRSLGVRMGRFAVSVRSELGLLCFSTFQSRSIKWLGAILHRCNSSLSLDRFAVCCLHLLGCDTSVMMGSDDGRPKTPIIHGRSEQSRVLRPLAWTRFFSVQE